MSIEDQDGGRRENWREDVVERFHKVQILHVATVVVGAPQTGCLHEPLVVCAEHSPGIFWTGVRKKPLIESVPLVCELGKVSSFDVIVGLDKDSLNGRHFEGRLFGVKIVKPLVVGVLGNDPENVNGEMV